MSLVSGAANAYFTYKFLRTLTKKWEDMDAYKTGLIDENGKVIVKKSDRTQEQKDSYGVFDRLAFNIKRILEKLPFGKTRLANYASALFLLKEKAGFDDEQIEELLSSMEIDFLDSIEESTGEWFIDSKGRMSPGTFTLVNDIASPETLEAVAFKGQKVISEGSSPVGEVLGIQVYKVKHKLSGQEVFVTSKDINR